MNPSTTLRGLAARHSVLRDGLGLPAPRPLRRGLRGLAVTIALIAAVGCGAPPQAPPVAEDSTATVTTTVAIAQLAPIPVLTEASGSVEASRTASPATKIMGRVRELTVREGDRVSAGQVIARIESADLEAAVAQARAAVVMAEATLENAATHHARMEQLHAQRSVTDKNLEDATAGHRVAAANLEVTRANLLAAEVMLSYAEVSTPISGWVSAKMIEEGDMAAPGRPLLVIEDLSRVKVRVSVPESAVVRLAPGQSADVTLLERTRPATIDRIMPTGDPATRTFTVDLVIDNPDGEIKAGMFARAAFETGVREVLHVPTSAIVERGQLQGVFTVNENDRAALLWVKLGPARDDEIEVVSGLRPGERYLPTPAPEVRDGVRVVTGR